jgi:hypothetical protein
VHQTYSHPLLPSFIKSENRRVEQFLSGEGCGEEVCGGNVVQILYTHERKLKKMIYAETIPGMGGRGGKGE